MRKRGMRGAWFLLVLGTAPTGLATADARGLATADARGLATRRENTALEPWRMGFEGGATSAPWINDNWTRRVQMSVNPDSIEGDRALLGFRLVLLLDEDNASEVFDHAKADGSDLLITKGDGTTALPCEIVTFDPTQAAAEVWVRTDTLSHSVHDFYLYFGNPDTTLADPESAVWGEDFLGVYHFSNSPADGFLVDSGPWAHHAVAKGGWTANDTIAGAIAQAWHFNGTTHWLDGDGIASSDSSYTISSWAAVWYPDSPNSDLAFNSSTNYWLLSYKRNPNNICADYMGQSGTPREGSATWFPVLPDTLLHHYLWWMDGVGDTIRFFFDGVEQSVRGRYTPAANTSDKIYTGNQIGGNIGLAGQMYGWPQDHTGGIVDEYWIQEGLRAPAADISDFIRTEYRNQRDPAGFTAIGEEESRAPVAAFFGEPTSGAAPLTVEFTDESTNEPTSWAWTFGDGETSSTQNPTHTYDDPGEYSVTLTVRNAGGTDTEVKADYITVTGPACTVPVADFAVDRRSGEVPLTVRFVDQSRNAPTSWSWNFGDSGGSTAQNPVHTYCDVGTFTVVLSAANAAGADVETKVAYISAIATPSPVAILADFEGSGTRGAAPFTVEFSDRSRGDATSWLWTFGDGETSRLANPRHTYEAPGAYTVTLTASGAGGTDVESKVEYISVMAAPLALWVGQTRPFLSGNTVSFSVPRAGYVKLALFSPEGRLVERLVDGYRDAGKQAVTWSAARHTEGLLFLRLSWERRVCTQRVVLIR